MTNRCLVRFYPNLRFDMHCAPFVHDHLCARAFEARKDVKFCCGELLHKFLNEMVAAYPWHPHIAPVSNTSLNTPWDGECCPSRHGFRWTRSLRGYQRNKLCVLACWLTTFEMFSNLKFIFRCPGIRPCFYPPHASSPSKKNRTRSRGLEGLEQRELRSNGALFIIQAFPFFK